MVVTNFIKIKNKKIVSFLIITILILTLNSQMIIGQYFHKLDGWVVDITGSLSQSEETYLESLVENYNEKTKNQLAICFIKTTKPLTIEEYAVALE
ncbi:MAG: hypothetical protein GYA61_02925 [Spirochaetales bacterium]|nr:hypothetical protein [Spirochaetales bacterium]